MVKDELTSTHFLVFNFLLSWHRLQFEKAIFSRRKHSYYRINYFFFFFCNFFLFSNSIDFQINYLIRVFVIWKFLSHTLPILDRWNMNMSMYEQQVEWMSHHLYESFNLKSARADHKISRFSAQYMVAYEMAYGIRVFIQTAQCCQSSASE